MVMMVLMIMMMRPLEEHLSGSRGVRVRGVRVEFHVDGPPGGYIWGSISFATVKRLHLWTFKFGLVFRLRLSHSSLGCSDVFLVFFWWGPVGGQREACYCENVWQKVAAIRSPFRGRACGPAVWVKGVLNVALVGFIRRRGT